ncbi:MAG: hypothetical protein AAF206_27040, partial [Bacteroidota bacterium]
MLRNLRKSIFFRITIVYLIGSHLLQIFMPASAFALTTGPTQPEVHNFQPAGASDLVNLSTGKFSYNIPVMDVGGYPLNLSYAGGIGMDEEAGMVGLGWNLGVGALTRNLYATPDDFMGDEITKTMNMRPNRTMSLKPKPVLELFGLKIKALGKLAKLSPKKIYWNNYKGFGFEVGTGFSPPFLSNLTIGLDF